MSDAARVIRASAIDLISAIIDAPDRPFDGALICRLRTPVSLDALERGAQSARNRYPKSACVLDQRNWRHRPELAAPIRQIRVTTPAERDTVIEDALNEGFDLAVMPSMRQLLIESDGLDLVTLCHHAAADVLSGSLWVGHQLHVASGRLPAITAPAPDSAPVLRTHDAPVRKSRYAHAGPSTNLWHRPARPGRRRCFRSVVADADRFRALTTRHEGFTYNDVLAAVCLDLFWRWNADHGARTDKIALWCPVNIRQRPFTGFGNGSSRVRVYPTLTPDAPLVDRCRELRIQSVWSRKNGEWFVPESNPLLGLPDALMRPVVRGYLNRPWVDMASGMFSHVERVADRADNEAFPEVEHFDLVGGMHRRYPFGIVAVSFRGETRMTFTIDPALLEPEDVDALISSMEQRLEDALQELGR